MASSRGGASGEKAPPQEENFFDTLFGMLACQEERRGNERVTTPGKKAVREVPAIAIPSSPSKVPPARHGRVGGGDREEPNAHLRVAWVASRTSQSARRGARGRAQAAHRLACGGQRRSSHHPGSNPGENLKSISHRCHPILVAFVWELSKETIHLPLGCLQGGAQAAHRLACGGQRRSSHCHPVATPQVRLCSP